MTGPEHYREAERRKDLGDGALDNAAERNNVRDAPVLLANAQAHYAAAQVHATLALAAATLGTDTP